ncbi:MAG: hypothetical protein Q9191_003840 [Dirinaria sp. TL-2023a]
MPTNAPGNGHNDGNNSKTPDKGSTHFLDLPLELRLKVYRLLVVVPSKQHITPWPVYMPRLSVAMLRVCSQVYREARSVLYGENRFLCTLSLPRTFGLPSQPFKYLPPHQFLTEIRQLFLEISDYRWTEGYKPLDDVLQSMNHLAAICSLHRLVIIFVATKAPLRDRPKNSWIMADEVLAALCQIRVEAEIVVKYRTMHESSVQKIREVSENMAAQRDWAITEYEKKGYQSYLDDCPRRRYWSLQPTTTAQ